MAITDDTLRLVDDLRAAVAGTVNTQVRRLVAAWAKAWDGMVAEMNAAVAELLAVGEGEWPTRAQIARATRAQRALEVARNNLERLAARAGVDLTAAAADAARITSRWDAAIIASQFPPSAADAATLAGTFDRVSPAAIEAIVQRTTGQITTLTRPLSAEATEAMYRALVRGVAVGENPRVAARAMVRGLEGAFNGGLQRALVIARTEIISAHRDAAMVNQAANTEVLQGWRWQCALDRRTCPSCIAQNGSLHPLSDPGPIDHQQGRCSRTPVTKSWKDLGFNVKEPPSVFPDSRKWFNGLPEKDQLAIMGPRRLELLRSGKVDWEDLSQLRHAPGWRDSLGVRPVSDLEGIVAA